MSISEAYIQQKIEELRNEYAHAGELCFFTDITNIPSIFEHGKLLCRTMVLRDKLMQQESAMQSILEKTPGWVHEHVRLYHAPRTPMLYQIEGIKRTQDEWPECPQPVYLVFDPIIVTLPDVRLSRGNMGSSYSTWGKATEDYFDNLPFHCIFNRGSSIRINGDKHILGMDPHFTAKIMRCRQAEILIPESLSLQYLRAVVFRSQAEKELAELSVGDFGSGVEVRVDRNWFFCDYQRRLYPDIVEHEGKRFIDVKNAEPGDVLIRIDVHPHGDFIVNQKSYEKPDPRKPGKWGAFHSVDPVGIDVTYPPPGHIWLYLYNHVIWDKPCVDERFIG